MIDTKLMQLATFYAYQFGMVGQKGGGYIAKILIKYLEQNLSPDTADYRTLINEVCADAKIQPASLKRAISRFVDNSWKQGFSDVWETFAGWDQSEKPDVDTAVKLICESFPTK